MKTNIGGLFSRINKWLFRERIEWEIYNQIAPHIHKEKDHGFPFGSPKELTGFSVSGGADAGRNLARIERTASTLPKAYGDAFRYIAYRDLNKRMQMYLELAEQSVQPQACDPRFVATRA